MSREYFLITDVWQVELRTACIAQAIGAAHSEREPTNVVSGIAFDVAGNSTSLTIESFKSESTEVFYSDELGRQVFVAGRPLGSGIGSLRLVAANATVLEIHGAVPFLPAVFSAESNCRLSFRRVKCNRLIGSLNESPFVKMDEMRIERQFDEWDKSFAKYLPSSRSRPFRRVETGEFLDGAWIPFNRVKLTNQPSWKIELGFVQLVRHGPALLCSESTMQVNSGTILGIECPGVDSLVSIAEVT